MRCFAILLLSLAVTLAPARAGGHRFVVDDEEYVDKVVKACSRLMQAGKLKSTQTLRQEMRNQGCGINLAPLFHQKLPAPDLCDRLRQSTFAVGTYYKCPECNDWHFNSSAGFAVAPEGILSTCCHVVAAEDPGVTESYLVAADDQARVFPVQAVLAADKEADTCFVRINETGLKPLPLRTGARTGERAYCLSHPGGYFFMFTQGMVARVNRKCNEALDEHGRTNGLLTRPILFLNVTAEFAPGSSGAAVVDESGNVIGQVASIADAGEPPLGETNAPPTPSVPVRFCTATEEILRLAQRETTPPLRPASTNIPISRPRPRAPH